MANKRVEKYVRFIETIPLPKTKTWKIRDKFGNDFAKIRWYGGWRKYVCYFDSDCYCDWDCLRLIADFCESKTKEHYGK